MRLLDTHDQPGFAPQPLQVVIRTEFWVEDVYNHRSIVEEHPTGLWFSFQMEHSATGLSGLFPNLIQDCPELGRTLGAAQNEIVSQQRDILHVQHHNVRAKAFGNGVYDHMTKLKWFQGSPSIKQARADRILGAEPVSSSASPGDLR
jgi:hypothetical protein